MSGSGPGSAGETCYLQVRDAELARFARPRVAGPAFVAALAVSWVHHLPVQRIAEAVHVRAQPEPVPLRRTSA